MKKILLVILLLTALASILLAEEIDNKEEKTTPILPTSSTKNYPSAEQIEHQNEMLILQHLNSSKYYPAIEEFNDKTIQEIIELCQIPDEKLQESSTEHLLTLCLDYPLYKDMIAYNSMQWGYTEISKHFNGIQELYNRDDIIPIIINKYYHCNNDSLIPYYYTIRTIGLLAKILSQNEVLGKSKNQKIKELLRYTLEKDKLNEEIKFYLLGKLLKYNENISFKNELDTNPLLNSYIIGGNQGNCEVFDTIKEISSDYLNKGEIK